MMTHCRPREIIRRPPPQEKVTRARFCAESASPGPHPATPTGAIHKLSLALLLLQRCGMNIFSARARSQQIALRLVCAFCFSRRIFLGPKQIAAADRNTCNSTLTYELCEYSALILRWDCTEQVVVLVVLGSFFALQRSDFAPAKYKEKFKWRLNS